MKDYDLIQPEVIVGIGENTEFEEKSPPFLTLKKLHINLEDWLGDDLMECHPAYIVTERLKIELENSTFSGFTFENMDVTMDEDFNNNYQLKKSLPKFFWIKLNGKKNTDDFFINEDSNLCVDKNVTSFLKSNFTTKFLDINPEVDTEQQDILQMLLNRAKARNESSSD